MAANAGIFHQCETTLAVHVELRKLLICDYLATYPLVERFRLNCRAELPLSLIQEPLIENILDFLEAKGLFSEGNYSYVKEKSADVHVYIIELIEQAESRIMEIKKNALLVSTFVTDVHPSHFEKETKERVDAILLAVFEFIMCKSNKPYANIPALCERFTEFQTMSKIFLDIWHGEFCKCGKYFGQKMLLHFIASAAIHLSYGDDQFEHFKKNKFPHFESTLRKSANNIFHLFNDCGAIPVSGVKSSVLSYWIFDNVSSLDTLWDKYKKGDLDAALQKCFNSREALCLLNVEKVSLRMEIRNEDYLQYRTKLEAKGQVSEGYLKGTEKKAADVQVKIIESTPRAGDRIKEIREVVTEKFLAEISKKIGSEWILVCVTLGVPSYVIDQIKIDGTSDVPTKIFEGLRRWRELRREISDDELIVELKEALGEHGRQDLVEVVENHIKKCMLEKERNKNTALHSMETEDTEVKDFREKLHTLNYLETQKVPVSPLQRTSKMPLENIVAPISIREDLEYQGKGRNIGMKNKRTKPVNSPDDMFYIDGDVARNVFMLGDAGVGKSVFCLRLVENWCKAQKIGVSDRGESDVSWVEALKNFDFLFFVQLRHVNKSRSSVIDMIVNDVFHSHPGNHDVIRRVLYSQRFRCLIVVDGVDEWKVTDQVRLELKVEGLPNTENMVNCTFVWSMRPWVIDRFSEMIRGNDRVVEIQGLDTDSINVVIEKMLVNFYELDKESSLYKEKEKYITEKSNDQTLESIMQIPLMAVACIQIWFEGKEVGNSMASLYVAILDLLIRRSNKKFPLTADIIDKLANQSVTERKIPKILNQNENIKQVMTMIMKLGRIAHDDLLSKETHLVFRVEDIEKYLEEYELDLALRIGILSKCEAPGSFNEENVSVNFFHKSVEEFLAATYIENQGQIQTFFGHLSSVEVIMELGNVLIFLSGLNPMLGSRISKQIFDVANVDTNICKVRTLSDASIYRNNKVELLYRLQVNCYKEIKYAQSSENTTQELSYHVPDVDVDDNCDIEIIKVTADILTHHHTDIRSLHLYHVSTDVENGIPDSLLTQYLDHTVSLQSLCIYGYNTNRTLHHISDIFTSLSALILYDITLTPDALSTLQTTLQSNTVIQTLGLVYIECQVTEDQGPELASLAGIIQTLPDLSRLSTLEFEVANENEKDVFRDVLSRLSHLHGIRYYGTYLDDDEYDCYIVQTLSTWSGLRWLCLACVDLGDSGLQLSHDMLHIEQINLDRVDMSLSGWRNFIQSVLNIKHKFDVDLDEVDIDEEVKTMIRSTPEFEVSLDESNDDGTHDIYFTRVWPPSEQRQP